MEPTISRFLLCAAKRFPDSPRLRGAQRRGGGSGQGPWDAQGTGVAPGPGSGTPGTEPPQQAWGQIGLSRELELGGGAEGGSALGGGRV